MRCATVGSGTRNARAISSVVKPPSRRSVSATRPSAGSTGWQAVNTNRKRSSPMSSSIALSRFATANSCCAWSSRPSSPCLRSSSLLRRNRSRARCLAVAINHAPGLSGMPAAGHCSSAATSASCASSSARPTSRTMRASPAIIRADSILQTASMARCVSAAVTATDNTTQRFLPARCSRPAPTEEGGFVVAQHAARFCSAQACRPPDREVIDASLYPATLWRHVLRPKNLPHLGLPLPSRPVLAVQLHELHCAFNGLLSRIQLKNREAAHDFLGLAERPVDRRYLSLAELHSRGRRHRRESASQHHALVFHRLFRKLLYRVHQFLRWRARKFRVFHHHHESHRRVSILI